MSEPLTDSASLKREIRLGSLLSGIFRESYEQKAIDVSLATLVKKLIVKTSLAEQ